MTTKANYPRSLVFGLVIISFGFLLVAGPACSGGEKKVDADLSKLLPDQSLRVGFERQLSQTTYDRARIWDYIGPSADIYLFNGFQKLLVARYANQAGDTLTCEIFELASPRESFALYSNMREPGYTQIAVGREGYLLKGNIFGRFHSRAATPEKFSAAAQSIADQIQSVVELPAAFSYFPENRIANSERVTLEDFLGQTEFDNVYSVAYELGHDTATLYLSLVGKNMVAEAVRAYMGGTGVIKEMIFDGPTQGFVGENEKLGELFCKARDQVLVLVVNYGDRADAERLADGVFALVDKLGLPDETTAEP
jgi:hypothetical protein